MSVDQETAQWKTDFKGKTWCFCSSACRTKFIANPGKYLAEDSSAVKPDSKAPMTEGVVYTCPMHPEIRRIGPGACPICGMALEPLAIS